MKTRIFLERTQKNNKQESVTILPLQLRTERLLFRRYTEEDLPFLQQLVHNEEVMRYIGDGQVKDEAYALSLYTRMHEQYRNFDDYGLHMLIHHDTGERIGHAGIVAQVIDDCFEIEVGYWIHPVYWRQGYAFEAAAAVTRYATEECGIERLVSMIMKGNSGSIRIAEKNGFTLEKTIQAQGKEVLIYALHHAYEE